MTPTALQQAALQQAAHPGTVSIAFDVLQAAHADAAGIAERQHRRWVALLQAARESTPHYRKLLQGRDLEHLPLQSLPVTGKPALMRQFAAHVADPAITLAGVRGFCSSAANIGQRYLGRYWVWESSGSTGHPGIFVQDERAMALYDALEGTRRHAPQPWRRFVDPMYLGERFAFVGATGGHFASHVSVQRLRAANPLLQRSWRAFSILQPLAELAAALNDFDPTILATYPTAAVMLADAAAAGRLPHCRPREVWTGGETLTPAMRARIEAAFGCALTDSYGASEFLPIAWGCAHGRLHVNADWVILEPVDARHRPMLPGRASHTTLLTNLANHVQPLIRFDIGDRIVLGGPRCPCGSALPVVQVQGRSDDAIVVPGRDGAPVTLLPLALTTVLEEQAGLFDFELRQCGAHELSLGLGPGAARGTAAARGYRQVLTRFLHGQGACDIALAVHRLEASPLAASGKCKRIVAAHGR